ncbi:hypothetical protein ACFLTJ_00055 [Chloroflexota bacterium]
MVVGSDMTPISTSYTGIVVANEGTLYAATDYLNWDSSYDVCDSDRFGSGDMETSGVARNLAPCETPCCGEESWDYLVWGLNDQEKDGGEYFNAQPTSLRICGCLSTDTNSVLWAIDTDRYDVENGSGSSDHYGQLWSYEDCAAKVGPTLLSPADGDVLDCAPCAGCDPSTFTLSWEGMCDACSWDIEIMDEGGNLVYDWTSAEVSCSPPELFVDPDVVSYLECGNTYTWHVRMSDTTCECIHSPWSETWSFTIEAGAGQAVQLLSPNEGKLGVPVGNVGFSWTGVPDATSYSFVLSPNANLSSALASEDLSTTAFNFVGPLEFDKAYYWQVIACKNGTRLSTSSVGVFQHHGRGRRAPAASGD